MIKRSIFLPYSVPAWGVGLLIGGSLGWVQAYNSKNKDKQKA